MKRRHLLLTGLAAMSLLLAGRPALALGKETFGNAPLPEGNYKEWPGVVTVVNHPTRVYQTWVNGNEDFYYQGDVATLNDWLRRYATVATGKREVVLRPGPGSASSFDRSKQTPYGWHLSLIGGIAGHLRTRDRGAMVWSATPVVTIQVTPELDLTKLEIPKGVTVTSLAEVKRRTREGLKSTDKTVRGWGTGVLAALDRFDPEIREAVVIMLKDEDNWVRLNAAGALSYMGRTALPAVPQLRELLKSDDAQLREQAQQSIKEIEAAPDQADLEKAHREANLRIAKFLEAQAG